MSNHQNVIEPVKRWLEDVVIGLNLCPFARKPTRAGQVRFAVSDATSDQALMGALQQELNRLDQYPPEELETTLLIVPDHLQRFDDYNQFLELAEWLIDRQGYSGIYQLASFHPDYQFAGTSPEDPENLTNRAPYPILHLIREASIDRVLARYPDPESIPDNNIRCVNALTEAQKRKLFPYLFS